MSRVVVDVALRGGRIPLTRAQVSDLVRDVLRAERVERAAISVTFVESRRIAALNRRHLGHAGPTDVISFGFRRARWTASIVGDIYIAPSVARRNAEAQGVTVREEIARLVVHGVLHTLGFDHPQGMRRTASPMWRRQEELLRRVIRPSTGARSPKRKRRPRAA